MESKLQEETLESRIITKGYMEAKMVRGGWQMHGPSEMA